MTATLPPDLQKKLSSIKALVLDVDGVLTDGRLWLGDDGQWRRFFHIQDGAGVKSLINRGYKVGWITGSRSIDIKTRAEMLGVGFLADGLEDKQEAFNRFLESSGLSASQVAYMGDDLVDIPLLQKCGLSITVPNAAPEVAEIASLTTKRRGGEGAVREVCDLILKFGSLKA